MEIGKRSGYIMLRVVVEMVRRLVHFLRAEKFTFNSNSVAILYLFDRVSGNTKWIFEFKKGKIIRERGRSEKNPWFCW